MSNNDSPPPQAPPPASPPVSHRLPPKKGGPKTAPWVIAIVVAILAYGIRQGLRSSARGSSSTSSEPEVVTLSQGQVDESYDEIMALDKQVKTPLDAPKADPANMKTEVGKLYARTLTAVLEADAERANLLLKVDVRALADPASWGTEDKRRDIAQRLETLEKESDSAALMGAEMQVENFIKAVNGGVMPEDAVSLQVINEVDMTKSYIESVKKLLEFAKAKNPIPSTDGKTLQFDSVVDADAFDDLKSKVEGWLDNWNTVHEENIATARAEMIKALKRLRTG